MTFFRFKLRWLLFLLVVSFCLLQLLSKGRQYQNPFDYETFQAIVKKPHENALELLSQSEAKQLCQAYHWDVFRRTHPRRKIYDLFMVNTELDMLKVRLNELQHHVDYFVIIEANITFTGLPKPVISSEVWAKEFASYKHKIIQHTLVDPGIKSLITWDHEDLQRNSMYDQVFPMLSGEQKPELGDVILVSDLDEIPRPETLAVLRNCKFPRRLTLRSRFYYYSFQWLHRGEEWAHPQATFYEGDSTIRPANLRNGEGGDALSNWLAFKDKADLWNASWSCSWCFSTLEETLRKMSSSSHTKWNSEKNRDRAGIVKRVRNGIDIFERELEAYERINNNSDVPALLKAKPEEFGYMLDRDGADAGFKDFDPAKQAR
ncbi:hypothetical protein MMC09_000165 [Bachmanniomyces sp. S44760]|nr:hypothetical protein [Bachmanniomyces sp. S44760]